LTFHSTLKEKRGKHEHSATKRVKVRRELLRTLRAQYRHCFNMSFSFWNPIQLLGEGEFLRGYYRSQLRNELLNDMGQIQRTAHCTTKTCHSVLRLRSSSAGSIRPHMKQLLVQRHRERGRAAIVELRLLDLRLPGLPRCITREPRTVWACMIFGDWSTDSSWLSLFEKV
jgi:hypothetical protein